MRRGFSLIELMIALIIIGILTTIAAPMMQAMKVRGICSEAVTTMGVIRTALREYYIANDRYPSLYVTLSKMDPGVFKECFPGIDSADSLTGTYFGKECYVVATATPSRRIFCYTDSTQAGPTPSSEHTAPKWEEAKQCADSNQHNNPGIIYMHIEPYSGGINSGEIQQENVSRSGYPNGGPS